MNSKKEATQILAAGLFAILIIFNLNMNTALSGPSESISVEPAMLQTATVPCYDTENYGEGPNRDRVCAHGTVAFCDWENWSLPGNLGECTLDGPEEG